MEDGASAPTAAAVLASTRKVRIRDFRGGTGDQDVEIHWMVPDDYVGGIKFRPIMFVSNATAPANNETIIFSLAGCSIGNSDILSCSVGTAQTSTLTADATYVQYDRIAGPYSSEITITNATAGESAMLKLFRDQANDTYAQVIGLAGIEIKYKAKVMLNSTY
jgi:hypothetical protein